MPRPTEITFQAGEITLAGELLLPEADPRAEIVGRHPWVLLVAAGLPRDRDGALDRERHPGWFAPAAPMPEASAGLLRRLAHALADRGVASFRYDTRGCGASEGDWAASDLFTRIDDARDALGAMRGRRELDLSRTGMIGHGEGATIALSVAIPDPAISAMTLVGAAARSPRDGLRRAVAVRGRTGVDRQHPLVAALDRLSEELIERVARHETEMRLPLGDGAPSARLNLAAFEQAFATAPVALATMLHRSVALVHGADDAWNHPDESRLLQAILRSAGNDPTLRVVDGGHDLAGVPDAVIGELAVDLAERIAPVALPPVLAAIQPGDHP